jgi:hypothetical protein
MGKKNSLIREQQANDIEALQKMLDDPNITAETKQGIQGLIANAQKFAQQQPAAPATQETSTTQPAPAAQQAAPVSQYSGSRTNPYTTQYKGPSIVDFLKQSGQASDKASRAKLAVELGIVEKPEDYKFTAAQNTQMLNTLKQKATKIDQAIASKNPAPPQQQNQNVAAPAPQTPEEPQPQAATPQPQGQINTKNYAGGKRGGSVQRFEAEKAKTKQEQPEEGEENEEGSKKFQYFGLNKTTVQEKNNISKFLRHVSEKNYSSAHKYLKAIVESKIKRNILQKIGKI